MSVGIENLVANEIIVPPGGNPILASWDRPFFEITNPNAYPSTYGPVNSDNIVAGWSVDYASSNPSFIVGLADWWGTEESGYSTNGGQTWTKFATDDPWRRLLVHGRNDRRQHAAEHHLGAGGQASSPITRSTAARPGARSRFPASRAGAASTRPITSTSGR